MHKAYAITILSLVFLLAGCDQSPMSPISPAREQAQQTDTHSPSYPLEIDVYNQGQKQAYFGDGIHIAGGQLHVLVNGHCGEVILPGLCDSVNIVHQP